MEDNTGIWIVRILLIGGAIVAGLLKNNEVAGACGFFAVISFIWF